MKTVIDVVNKFKGEHHIDPELGSNYTQFIECLVDLGEFGRGDISVGNGVRSGYSCWEPICTIDEFAECLEWCESWQPTLTSDYFNNMSYKKYVAWYSTVEQVERSLGEEINKPELAYDKDGYGYEVGKRYLFSDNEADWYVDCLEGVDHTSSYPFSNTSGCSKFIKLDNTTAGTITPPEVKLVDGQAYMFDYKGQKGLIGIVHTSIKLGSKHVMFCMPKLESKYNSEYCTNIIPLVKG